MIGFVMPWVLGAAVFGAIAVTALHFLSVRRPPVLLLPTARFLANRDVRAVSRSTHPSDVLLLLLRVLALLFAGIAFAGPRWMPVSRRVVNLIVADRSWMRDSGALLTLVHAGHESNAAVGGDNRIVWSDTVAVNGSLSGMRAELAAAFPLALRAASQVVSTLRDADSVALNIVLPPGGSASSEAWSVWRTAWPGAIRVYSSVPTGLVSAPLNDSSMRVVVHVTSADADDAVTAAYASHAVAAAGASYASATRTRTVRVRRQAIDTTTIGNDVTVLWPTDGMPEHWRAINDTVGAFAARGIAMVAPFTRRARVPAELLRKSRAIAWWSDGDVAAVEQMKNGACVRHVGIALPSSGDVLLGESARGLLDALIAPCGVQRRVVPIAEVADDPTQHAKLAVAAALRIANVDETSSHPAWLAPLLLLLALTLLFVEWAVRDRRRALGTPPPASA